VQSLVDAEIEYSGITDDGLLRAAVFKGLRDEVPPTPVDRGIPSRWGKGHSLHNVAAVRTTLHEMRCEPLAVGILYF